MPLSMPVSARKAETVIQVSTPLEMFPTDGQNRLDVGSYRVAAGMPQGCTPSISTSDRSRRPTSANSRAEFQAEPPISQQTIIMATGGNDEKGNRTVTWRSERSSDASKGNSPMTAEHDTLSPMVHTGWRQPPCELRDPKPVGVDSSILCRTTVRYWRGILYIICGQIALLFLPYTFLLSMSSNEHSSQSQHRRRTSRKSD